MQYPLTERIGPPDLLVGRKAEFERLNHWLRGIHKRISWSIALLARKKSGKTAIAQRMFNQLWTEKGAIVPFYYEIKANRIWLPDFAVDYFRHFATQFISFREHDVSIAKRIFDLEQIQDYAQQQHLDFMVTDVDQLVNFREQRAFGNMWTVCYNAPHMYADLLDCRWVVILDEFQNIAEYIYMDEACVEAKAITMAGSYHERSESKIAPMFVTGSYVGWLVNVINKYLEAGRLKFWELSPSLASDEGLEAVYRYAEVFEISITHESAVLINDLCQSDPYFISCVLQSQHPDKDLTQPQQVGETVQYELTQKITGFARTWAEYIDLTLDRINNVNARRILLYLTKHSDREWTHREIQEALKLDLDLKEVLRQLLLLVEMDLIDEGTSNIRFQGLRDGTLFLILRNRFEEEAHEFAQSVAMDFDQHYEALKHRNHQLQGKLNQLAGKIVEDMLATELRRRKRIHLQDFFEWSVEENPVKAEGWNLIEVRTRQLFQRPDGKNFEIDVLAHSDDSRWLVIETKKLQTPLGKTPVEDFVEKLEWLQTAHPQIMMTGAFIALGGFTQEALALCHTNHLLTAHRLFFLDHLFEE